MRNPFGSVLLLASAMGALATIGCTVAGTTGTAVTGTSTGTTGTGTTGTGTTGTGTTGTGTTGTGTTGTGTTGTGTTGTGTTGTGTTGTGTTGTGTSTTPAFTITGTVNGGLAPISAAHVYLFAIGTTGYAGASVSLLSSSITQLSDSTGAFVSTDTNGVFNIPSTAFTCTAGQMTYLLATGGSTGAGANSASSMMAALGPCPTAALPANPWVNEVTTVGTAYALAGFATDDVHISSSGTAAATLGIENALTVVPNLYNPVTGAANLATPNGNGQAPQLTVNLIANILASCVNSGSATSGECRSLFGAASATIDVTDTATAAILIAHQPAANVATLFSLQALGGATFEPTAFVSPTSFVLPIVYTGGILSNPLGVTVDANGNVWVGSGSTGQRNAFSTAGVPVSTSGYTDGLTGSEYSLAVDSGDDVWGIDEQANLLSELSPTGQILAAPSLFTSAQLMNPFGIAFDHTGMLWVGDDNGVTQINPNGTIVTKLAIPSADGDGIADVEVDGLGNIWATNFDNNTLVKLSASGTPAFGTTGVGGGGLTSPQGIAFDAQNNVWIANANGTSVSKFSNAGAPLSPTGFLGGGVADNRYLAVDGAGYVWTPSSNSGVIGEFDNSGNPIIPLGFVAKANSPGFWGIALDGSGNVWATSTDGALVQLVGAATPVITPLSTASRNNTLGTRP
jgi:hypothetical protein